jgi:hypothetical protein
MTHTAFIFFRAEAFADLDLDSNRERRIQREA